MISNTIEIRIVNYFARLDSLKPSEFSNNYVNEWHYLNALKDLVLKDIEEETPIKNDGDDLEKNLQESGLLL